MASFFSDGSWVTYLNSVANHYFNLKKRPYYYPWGPGLSIGISLDDVPDSRISSRAFHLSVSWFCSLGMLKLIWTVIWLKFPCSILIPFPDVVVCIPYFDHAKYNSESRGIYKHAYSNTFVYTRIRASLNSYSETRKCKNLSKYSLNRTDVLEGSVNDWFNEAEKQRSWNAADLKRYHLGSVLLYWSILGRLYSICERVMVYSFAFCILRTSTECIQIWLLIANVLDPSLNLCFWLVHQRLAGWVLFVRDEAMDVGCDGLMFVLK